MEPGPETQTAITGDVSGASQPLAVGVSGGAFLTFSASDAEVGAVTVTGADASLTGVTAPQNGQAAVAAGASLNATDGRPINVTHAGFVGFRGSVGSLSTTGAYVQVGAPQSPAAGSLAVGGSLTLDAGSDMTFSIIDNTGNSAGTDYSQLTATGPVALGRAGLTVFVGTFDACPSLVDGTVYTLVSTSDAVSGTFGGLPDGAKVPALGVGGCQSHTTLRIDYTAHAVTATVVSGGSGAGQPSATIRSPASGATYNQGQTVAADYSCSAGANGGVLQSCVGPVPNGSPIDTATAGRHTFTVTATDTDGQTASTTNAYTVLGPPTVTITTPPDGASYNRGQVIRAEYSCQDAAGAPGIDSCVGTVAAGSAIDTSTSGRHTFTVTATSHDGQTATATTTYTVPATAPADYTWTGASTVGADWSDAANWAGGTAPGGRVLTLAFPPCETAQHMFTCSATDDVAGLTATRLSIAGRFDSTPGGSWDLAGPATLTLTSGLSTTFENHVNDGQYSAAATLRMPITLGGANTWDIAQSTTLTGELSGSSQTLTVHFQPPFADNLLSLEGPANEVGPVTIAGAAGCCFIAGWDQVYLGRAGPAGDLNAVDGHSVTVNAGASIAGHGRVGPLVVQSGGAVQPSLGNLDVNGDVTLHSGSSAVFTLNSRSPRTAIAHITAHGAAALGGALQLETDQCNLAPGTSFTLLEASGGAVTGIFSDTDGFPLGNGSSTQAHSSCANRPTFRIEYTGQAVTATVLEDPTVVTGPAIDVSDTTATLTGTVNPGSDPVLWSFAGDRGTLPVSLPREAGTTAVSSTLSDLEPDTTYRYRLTAHSQFGGKLVEGATRSFTTTLHCGEGSSAPGISIGKVRIGHLRAVFFGAKSAPGAKILLEFGPTSVPGYEFRWGSAQQGTIVVPGVFTPRTQYRYRVVGYTAQGASCTPDATTFVEDGLVQNLPPTLGGEGTAAPVPGKVLHCGGWYNGVDDNSTWLYNDSDCL